MKLNKNNLKNLFLFNKNMYLKFVIKKNIIITGGGGFIGKNLIKAISNECEILIVIDNFISSSENDLYEMLKENNIDNVIVCNYDITNMYLNNYVEEIKKVNNINRIDEIYHLASIASPVSYKKYDIETLDVGYIGTKNILELAQKENSKILYTSTSEVYGDPLISPQNEDYYGNVNPFGERSCYSDDTEILTENGYKLFSELNNNEKVATLNQNNELEYHIPDEIIKEKYIGEMYEFKNWNIDLNVTPNHKMYVKKRNYKEFELLTADSKFSWDRAILKKTCDYIGNEQEWFYFPKYLKGLPNQKIPFVEKINMDVWLEFMGYYLSEGHTGIRLQKKKGLNGKIYESNEFRIQISQCEKKNPEKFQRIKECLDKLPFNYNISRAGNCYFVISNKQLAYYLKQFGKSKDKFIPTDLLSLSKRQLKILLDALILGDGTIRKNNSNNKTYKTYISSSYKLISGVQEILLKIGTFGNISTVIRTDLQDKKMYYIRINSTPDRNYTYIKPTINQYNGYVYCVNVKNHVIFVRRNGKALFCGNCYDESKRIGETLCYVYGKKYNMDIKIARIFNTYGEYMDINDGRIISEIFKNILFNRKLTIYGNGEQTRSFTYVEDTVNMLIKLMKCNYNKPLNIGTDNEITLNELLKIVENLFDVKLLIEYVEKTENDPMLRRPDLSKNKEYLGYNNRTSLENGLKKMFNYYNSRYGKNI